VLVSDYFYNKIQTMKKLLFLFTVLFANLANAQFFNNVNSELCFQLYTTGDKLGAYRVYVVVDNETTTMADTVTFQKWNGLSQFEKSKITQRWAMEGRRIESERAPYISYPPIFPNNNYFLPQPREIHVDWKLWEQGKKYWAYPDRPF
jgi:hypothetical protein